MHRTLWKTLCMSLLLVPVSGCTDDPCPPGQVEYDGECVDLIPPDEINCGPGTYYLSAQNECRPDPALCGAGTEPIFLLDEEGLPTYDFYCKGIGGGDLPDPPECPVAEPGGNICLNGWIRYLLDPENPTRVMRSLARFESPSVKVVVYDPLAYNSNPSVAPLGVGEVIHEDGTFRVENVSVPSTGFLALVVVDDEESGAENFVFTGFAYGGAAGVNLEYIDAYTVTAEQNTSWTEALGGQASITAAGCPNGASTESLYHCGTWVGVFAHGEPNSGFTFIEGVQPQKFPGPNLLPLNAAFYLGEDYDSFVVPASDAESHTNSTGIVFHPGARLGMYSGKCAEGSPCETAGYTWDQGLGTTGGSAPRAIFVQILRPLGYE